MGKTTYVIGFRPPDAKYQKLRAVYDACEAAQIEAPEYVQEYFNYEPPSEHGVEVDLGDAVRNYNADMQERYEVDLGKIPMNVHVIRFVNSY